MKYEEMISFLNDIPGTDFFSREEIIEKYYKNIKRFKVTQELLEWFSEEAKAIDEISTRREKILKDHGKKFVYYIQIEGKYAAITFSN